MDRDALAALRDEVLDWRYKGMPSTAAPVRLGDLGAQGYDALADLAMPALLLRVSALEHNLQAMARLCDRHAVRLAPHGKTTMAPQLFSRQLEAGAWAMTCATPGHLRVYRHFGVERVVYANELLDRAAVSAGEEELYVLADSPEAVQALRGSEAHVLVELGHPGGRTGCRTPAEAVAVAAETEAAGLELAGVEAFEGTAHDVDTVERLLDRVEETVAALDRPLLVSAGGSAHFDRVLARFAGRPDVDCVLRAGCYLTHDGGFYARASPLAAELRNAIELWGEVLSRPEPELAVASFGKRDAGFDLGMPVPFAAARGGQVRELHGEVVALSDQHAHVRIDATTDLRPGDRLGAHISHPCTTLDKWRLLFCVDDERRVVDGVLTFF